MPDGSHFFAVSGTTAIFPVVYWLVEGRYNTGISLFFTSLLKAGTSDAMICRHADNCCSSRALSLLDVSCCCWVGAASPASTLDVNAANSSFSMTGKARLAAEPFMFTWL